MKVDLAYERDDDNFDGDGRNDAVHPPVAVTLAKSRSVPVLFVNGRAIPPAIASLARPGQTLLDYLRNVLKLCGTKLGCGEGGCGACTVLISTFRTASGGGGGSRSGIVHAAVNACLYPALAADGKHVTTIEGVGSWKSGRARRAAAESCTGDDDDDLHPIQRALADGHGSQCGFCTPGIVMALYGALSGEDNDGGGGCGGGPPVHASELEERMDGNLCRCTGYRPIWDAARGLCRDGDGGTPDVEDLLAVGPVGSCGTPCRECPDRDDCVEECNVVDDDDIPPSYATPPMSSPMVVCTTESNMRELRAKRSEVERKWWTQPYEMFPDDLLPRKRRSDGDHGDGDEDGRRAGGVREFLARPLVVADATVHDGGTWFQPTTLVELLDLYRAYGRTGDGDGGGIKMVVGNTEVGIETKFKRMVYPRMVHPAVTIRSLYEIFLSGPSLVVGGCASLSDLQTFCHDLMMTAKDRDGGGVDANLFRTAMPTHDMLRWFASTQIRNVACLGGNLVTASPISDMNPLLCSHGASIVLASRPRADGGIERRRVDVSDFFLGYRRVDIAEIEVVERVEVPLVRSMFEYVAPFKQARRREDDISIVTSGMRIRLRPKENDDDCGEMHWTIDDVCIAYGGMAPVTKLARNTMTYMIGRMFGEETFVGARRALLEEFDMPDDVPGGQAKYRMTLAASFLHKFYLHCVRELTKDVAEAAASGSKLPPVPTIPSDEGGAEGFVSARKPIIRGVQSYPTPRIAIGLEADHLGHHPPDAARSLVDGVGKPAKHASGPLHCTGEALYTDDIPTPEDLIHGYLIMSSRCHAKLVSIDVAPALRIPGVVGAFTHKDIVALGGDNRMGPILLDDIAFVPVGGDVEHVGQVLGIVVGISQEIAEKGARAVAVEYEDLEGKAVVSIEDAIESKSFWVDSIHEMQRGGNVTEILQKTEVDGERKLVLVEGSIRSGGQEHFYLEPNTTLVVPSESATNLTIYASTQAVTKTQMFCASVTNTPASKVVCRMKRMGGGFGGKETRSVFVSVAAAVAAKMTNRPVKLTLNRDTDMSITGGRHAFLSKYKAGAVIDNDGTVKLYALDVHIYNNGGCKFDLTGPVLDRALFHVDNVYYWPNFHSKGTPCKTAQPPHTAFRGFGAPQGMIVSEHILDHLALACGVSGDKLRRDNIYMPDQCTPFGILLGGKSTGNWNVPDMWDQLYTKLDIPGRRAAAAEFNKNNRWKKRGVGFTPTKFGISFTSKFMNQGGALVHLYTDGTVLVSHGGTEMGQGLHTKVCQVAAQAFRIPLDHVYINDTSSDKVANTLPTAASMSTDLYGMATLDACLQILKRIQPIRDSLPPDAALKDVAKKAFFDRIDLSAHGFYALDNDRCGYDWTKEKPDGYSDDMPENSWRGRAFNYFTQGVALSEVEIDVLTGDHKTLSTDLLVDVGSSINPAIDIGQIEGAFIQGMGWSTIEEVIYGDDDHNWIRPRARVYTTGPGTYKIPAFNDVPESFNVSLFDSKNPFAVHSSKAVGEPPFFLGCSVFFAIKDAVTAAREGSGVAGYFEFRLPATSERIRMMCGDEISSECIAAASDVTSSFQPKGSF